MTGKTIIRNVNLINEGRIYSTDVLIKNGRIERIAHNDQHAQVEIDANGLHMMPGIIDDQVHFREPGLTHKADIYSESRAAAVGGVTSFMEMPNTKPPAVTQELLADKYEIATKSAWTNYSFFMGATNDNIEEVLKTDEKKVCGIKIFMGSSTGNMLVDQAEALELLFSRCPMLMATHCEDEKTIQYNFVRFKNKYGDQLNAVHHPQIRSTEGCLISSSKAVELAKKYNSRLHILHISTADEISLFEQGDRSKKRITSEACVHHMYFSDEDYIEKGNLIKCNPAIKSKVDRAAIRQAVVDGLIDVIATDHAPHTLEEKELPYINAPSGLPLIQHTLHGMLAFHKEGWMTLEMMVDKMCHAVADVFQIKDRGYVREGYWADLVLFNPQVDYRVEDHKIWSKCGWSPFNGRKLQGRIDKTFVNGNLVHDNGRVLAEPIGQRLMFER
jgi:dihydroorotase